MGEAKIRMEKGAPGVYVIYEHTKGEPFAYDICLGSVKKVEHMEPILTRDSGLFYAVGHARTIAWEARPTATTMIREFPTRGRAIEWLKEA